ncbi:hypothetical protein AcV5_007515 [Taiwanofungus camphoratus]|nr:hypothetical protein AcV5_007515 [Antrodia cinnamomea]
MFPCNADAKSRYILRCSLPGAVHPLRPAVDMASLTPTVIVVGIFFCGLIYSVLSLRTRRPPLPPGPKIWLFGSDKLPKSRPWLTYADWRQKFGDIIYIGIFGSPTLVLNSLEDAYELLVKRSNIYSSRPDRAMIRALMGWDFAFALTPYGSHWKACSTLFHQHFNADKAPDYRPILTKEAHVLLRNLAKTPDNLFYHVRRSASAIVMNILYGHQVPQEGDKYVGLAANALQTMAYAGIFGTYLVDYVPLLKHIPTWMPGASFKRKALEWRKFSDALSNEPFDEVKKGIASGTAVPSVTAMELENIRESGDPEQERVIKHVAAMSNAANSDVSASIMLSFFLAATIDPEILRKAQEEIDRVVGTGRLPTFADKDDLPYIMWTVYECLRWNPALPQTITHKTTEDDVYKGYFIPKGTGVEPNVWFMLHDERKYPDPLRFHPDRYADEKRNAELGINEIPFAAFGFGRRMCPGRWLALDVVWITIATSAAVFNISRRLDKNGVPIVPRVQYSTGLLSRPDPFECDIKPRSTAAAALIEQTADDY